MPERPSNPEELPSGLDRIRAAVENVRLQGDLYDKIQRGALALEQAAKLETMLRYIEDNPTGPDAQHIAAALENLGQDLKDFRSHATTQEFSERVNTLYASVENRWTTNPEFRNLV